MIILLNDITLIISEIFATPVLMFILRKRKSSYSILQVLTKLCDPKNVEKLLFVLNFQWLFVSTL